LNKAQGLLSQLNNHLNLVVLVYPFEDMSSDEVISIRRHAGWNFSRVVVCTDDPPPWMAPSQAHMGLSPLSLPAAIEEICGSSGQVAIKTLLSDSVLNTPNIHLIATNRISGANFLSRLLSRDQATWLERRSTAQDLQDRGAGDLPFEEYNYDDEEDGTTVLRKGEGEEVGKVINKSTKTTRPLKAVRACLEEVKQALVREACPLSNAFVLAIIHHESGGDPTAKSRTGYLGVGQVGKSAMTDAVSRSLWRNDWASTLPSFSKLNQAVYRKQQIAIAVFTLKVGYTVVKRLLTNGSITSNDTLDNDDLLKWICASYGAGPGNLRSLLQKAHESGIECSWQSLREAYTNWMRPNVRPWHYGDIVVDNIMKVYEDSNEEN
jgi:hypothetical protein